jgi:hypothetical protein
MQRATRNGVLELWSEVIGNVPFPLSTGTKPDLGVRHLYGCRTLLLERSCALVG